MKRGDKYMKNTNRSRKIMRYPTKVLIRHRSGGIDNHPQRYHINVGKRYKAGYMSKSDKMIWYLTREEEARLPEIEEKLLGEYVKTDFEEFLDNDWNFLSENRKIVKEKYKDLPVSERVKIYLRISGEERRKKVFKDAFKEKYVKKMNEYFDRLDEIKDSSKTKNEFLQNVDKNYSIYPPSFWDIKREYYYLMNPVGGTDYAENSFENEIYNGVFSKYDKEKEGLYAIGSKYFLKKYYENPKEERKKWINGVSEGYHNILKNYALYRKYLVDKGKFLECG